MEVYDREDSLDREVLMEKNQPSPITSQLDRGWERSPGPRGAAPGDM